MFVLSAGMPKSGSTLLSFLQKNIIEKGINPNGQAVFEEKIREGSLNGIGHFIHDIQSSETLDKLWQLSLEYGPFVVKTHAALTDELREFIVSHEIVVTFIHRDPRDIILSAIDHGKRPMKNPAVNSYFLRFSDISHSIPIVREFCTEGLHWFNFSVAHAFSYREVVSEPLVACRRFELLVNTSIPDSTLDSIILEYTVGQEQGKRQFNTGKLLRYIDEMTDEEILQCNKGLSNEILGLGYLL